MPQALKATLKKIDLLNNKNNKNLLLSFYDYMNLNNKSQVNMNNYLRVALLFSRYLDKKNIKDIESEKDILGFLNSRRNENDIEQVWINTWNDYLIRLRGLFRWRYNSEKNTSEQDWVTPDFIRKIKKHKSKRLSPYSNAQIWNLSEWFKVIEYVASDRKRTILAISWDLNARPHEITKLRIKDIKPHLNYMSGRIPHNTKTGERDVIFTHSVPYIRYWFEHHPNKDNPNAYLIYNEKYPQKPIVPDGILRIFKEVRDEIKQRIDNGDIVAEDAKLLDKCLKEKVWSPYCLRHSSITHDANTLPDAVVINKVGWSQNTKQRSRYIKGKMTIEAKNMLLKNAGIEILDEDKPKPVLVNCHSCNHVNSAYVKTCQKCGYILSQEYLQELKQQEQKLNDKIQLLKNENLITKYEIVIDRHVEKILDKAESLSRNNRINEKDEVENRELFNFINKYEILSVEEQKELFHDSIPYENLNDDEKKWIDNYIIENVKERRINFRHALEEFYDIVDDLKKEEFRINQESKILNEFKKSSVYQDRIELIKDLRVVWIDDSKSYIEILLKTGEKINWNKEKGFLKQEKKTLTNKEKKKVSEEFFGPSAQEFTEEFENSLKRFVRDRTKERRMLNNIKT